MLNKRDKKSHHHTRVTKRCMDCRLGRASLHHAAKNSSINALITGIPT